MAVVLERMGVALAMVGLQTHLQPLSGSLSAATLSAYPRVRSRLSVTLLL